MKKIGLTINDNELSLVEKWAKENHLPITTICSLILKHQLHYLSSRNIVPRFKTRIVVELNKPSKEETINEPTEDDLNWEDILSV